MCTGVYGVCMVHSVDIVYSVRMFTCMQCWHIGVVMVKWWVVMVLYRTGFDGLVWVVGVVNW